MKRLRRVKRRSISAGHRGRSAQVAVDMKKLFGAAIERLHIGVGDGPRGRDSPFVLNHAEVFGPHAEHRGAVDLGLATHEIRLLGMERFAVLVLPGLFGVVTIVEENGGRVPVELLLRHEWTALQNENVLARLGQMQSQRSASRSGTNDNRVIFVLACSSTARYQVYLLENTNSLPSGSLNFAIVPHTSFFGSAVNSTPLDLRSFAVANTSSHQKVSG